MTTDVSARRLLAWLRSQREHVLQAIDGLPAEALRRPVLPSGWTCLGLVQHLTLDVERFWFGAVVAGEDVHLDSGDQAWHVSDDTSAEAVLSAYRAESEQSDRVIAAAADLDAEAAWWPVEVFADLPVRDLRQTILHVITETACHAGHLDPPASCWTAINTSSSPDHPWSAARDVAHDGLGALTLFVEDVEATAAFYRDVLDLQQIHQDDVSIVFRLGSTLVNVLAVSAAGRLVEPVAAAPAGGPACMMLTLG